MSLVIPPIRLICSCLSLLPHSYTIGHCFHQPYLLITSGPLTTITCAPASYATAFAIIVFPTPGGPYNNTPLGGETPDDDIQRINCTDYNSVLCQPHTMIHMTSYTTLPTSGTIK